MLPPGIGLTAVSEKAMKAAKDSKLPKSFFAWEDMVAPNKNGFFPYTPATNLLYGLAEAIDMLHEEGLDRVFARHIRHGEATRRAVRAWGLEILCKDERAYSPVLTAILMPQGYDADNFRKVALEHFDISLGAGLGKIAGKVFRIGHLGDTNDLTILGALAGVEMSLSLMGVPHKKGGVQAAMQYLAETAKAPGLSAA
jgi:alanine-glyoxylate transaminase/serine-glyoxylate transaminase/serine-pyruvate transaminase